MNPTDYVIELERYKKDGANLICAPPVVIRTATVFTPVADVITLSMEKGGGDVYQQFSGGKYILTSRALAKLAWSAGVSWDPDFTMRTDNGNNRDYVSFNARGQMRRFDGSIATEQEVYDLDMMVVEEDTREQCLLKNMSPAETEKKVRKEMIAARKHKLKKCETSAKSRVIRKLLGVKGEYTVDEMRKPFVVYRYIVVPNYDDPFIQRKLREAAVLSITGVYGGQNKIEHNPTPPTSDDGFADGTVIDMEAFEDKYLPPEYDYDDIPPEPPVAPPPTKAPGNGQKSVQEQEIDFSNCDPEEQLKTLEKLAKRKAYDLKTVPKPLAQFNDTNRIQFFRKLITMPDVKQAA